MQANVLRENLLDALKAVTPSVANRSTHPILSHILLEAAMDGKMRLRANNLETGVSYAFAAQVIKDGAITVPAGIFSDLVHALPEEEIALTVEPETGNLHLNGGRFSNNLRGMSADEFPMEADETQFTRVAFADTQALLKAIKRVSFAADKTETSKPVFQGVHLVFGGGNLTLEAADGYRLSRVTLDGLGGADEARDVICPVKSLETLGRVLAKTDDQVDIYLDAKETRILFRAGDVSFHIALMGGNFPDLDTVINNQTADLKTRVVCDTKALHQAVRLAYLFTKSNKHAGVRLAIGSAAISVETGDSELGDNTNRVDAQVTGEEANVWLRAQYLMDVLKAVDVPQLTIDTDGAASPVVVRSDKNAFISLIMPLNKS